TTPIYTHTHLRYRHTHTHNSDIQTHTHLPYTHTYTPAIHTHTHTPHTHTHLPYTHTCTHSHTFYRLQTPRPPTQALSHWLGKATLHFLTVLIFPFFYLIFTYFMHGTKTNAH